MKKLLFILAVLPLSLFSQYMSFPTHYDAQETSKHIIHGDLGHYLQDTIEFSVEKKNGDFKTKNVTSDKAIENVSKILSKGNCEFSSKTNGGYIFTISVISKKDETVILKKAVFYVDVYTQKIKSIEIIKGE
jgi:hypothetical protein